MKGIAYCVLRPAYSTCRTIVATLLEAPTVSLYSKLRCTILYGVNTQGDNVITTAATRLALKMPCSY